jgi:hypothetical protein
LADSTGRMDRSGAGPRSVYEWVAGVPTNHYTHENLTTKLIELVKANPAGVPDQVLWEFPDRLSARLWLNTEWLAGRLRG